MRCPKCQFDHELQTTECLKCGIVFARYQAALEAEAPPQPHAPAEQAPAVSEAELARARNDAAREFKVRALALPAALILARLVVATGWRMAVRMLSMVLHESGHAIMSWFTGRWAVPMLWVTQMGENQSWLFILAL